MTGIQSRNKFSRERNSFDGENKRFSMRGNKRNDNNYDMSSDDSPIHHTTVGESNMNFGLRKRLRPDFYDRSRFKNRTRYNKYNDGDKSPHDDQNVNIPNKKGRYSGINNNFYFFGETTRSSLNDVVARMNTFKEFILTIDDNVHPEDAVDAYFDYVKTFSSKQLDPYFKNYNECDWMMLRYHPLWKDNERNFIRKCYQLRLNVFNQLLSKGYLNDLKLDFNNFEMRRKLYEFLIFLNILLECGSFEQVEECKKLLEKDDLLHKTTKITSISVETDNNELQEDEFKNYSSIDNEPNVDGLHRVVSFNIKAVPIDTSREEIYKCYGNIEGFLRAYISEPSLGKRDFRRAFLTFKPNIDISKVTKELNTIKFRENTTLLIRQSHELSRRVRCQELKTGCYSTLKTLVFDVKMVYDIIKELDKKYDIYSEIEEINTEKNDIEMDDSLEKEKSTNLVYFGKLLSEQDELQFNNLQLLNENPIMNELRLLYEKLENETNNIDENEIKRILDISILYLRIVYSVDYYGLIDYSYEHLRNIRCSTITVREIKTDNPEFAAFEEQILNISENEASK